MKKFQNIFSFQKELQNSFSDEINHIRNDLYFGSRGKSVLVFLRAVASLFRDLVYCISLSKEIGIKGDPGYVFCVSLMGSSGWGTLEPYYSLFQSAEVLVIKHPRLKGCEGWINPSAPSVSGWKKFFKALGKKGGLKKTGPSSLLIRIYLARATLWAEVWNSTISQLSGVKKIMLHNDFDMFSRGAVDSCRSFEVPTLCIQHGLPTDEFFPTSANSYLVWGASSAVAFKNVDLSTPNLKVGRFIGACETNYDLITDYPKEVALVSQTHTPVFGIDLAERLVNLSKAILEARKGFHGVNFSILLHPEECRVGNPYLGDLKKFCSRPPHRQMIRSKTQSPILAVGFCSTALIELARCGNYVLGLDWDINSSYGAFNIGAPPIRVKTAEEIFEVFNNLKSDMGYRELFISKQSHWISNTFKFLNNKSALELIEDSF